MWRLVPASTGFVSIRFRRLIISHVIGLDSKALPPKNKSTDQCTDQSDGFWGPAEIIGIQAELAKAANDAAAAASLQRMAAEISLESHGYVPWDVPERST